MSRKSARSKGYRHYRSKKNGLTSVEKRLMIILAVALFMSVVCAIFLPKVISRARYHVVDVGTDGSVRGMQDNWLVVNLSDDSTTKEYSHMADVEPLDGFVFDHTDYTVDPNTRGIYYVSDSSDIPGYGYIPVKGGYNAVAERNHESKLSMILSEVFSISNLQEDVIDGHKTMTFWANGRLDRIFDSEGNAVTPEMDADGNAVYPHEYMLIAYCYVDSPIKDRAVLISAQLSNTETNEFDVEPEALIELLHSAVGGIHYL